MHEQARQWLRWAGALYQDVVESGWAADAVLTRRLRSEGRAWGHDARRWVSAAVYAMAHTRPRTLWWWGCALRESEALRQALQDAVREAQGGEAVRDETEETGAGANASGGASGIARIGPLNLRQALDARLFPAEGDWGEIANLGGGLRLAESAVAWASRRTGGTLDLLARSLRTWLGPVGEDEALAALAEGARRVWPRGVGEALADLSARGVPKRPPTDEAGRMTWDYAMPVWLARRWGELLGPKEARALAALSEQPAPVYLRVNPLKSGTEGVLESLRNEGYLALPSAPVPGAVVVVHRANLFRSRAFEEGAFEVQDLSSQVVGLALDPQPGETVLDYCAGAGGKTLQLAGLMGNKGIVWALDVDARRLGRLRERAARAGVFTIRRALIDAIPEEAVREADARRARPGVASPFRPAPVENPLPLLDFEEIAEHGESAVSRPATGDVIDFMRNSLGLEAPPLGADVEGGAAQPRGRGHTAGRGVASRHFSGMPLMTEQEVRRLREAAEGIPSAFDAVLVDAPCSGTGVLRRHPDAAWRLTPQRLTLEVPLQAAVLRAAADYVGPGGRLVYATCSLLPEENEEQVLSLLAERDDFEPGDLGGALRRRGLGSWAPRDGACWMNLLPTRQPGDGFFVALLKRKK